MNQDWKSNKLEPDRNPIRLTDIEIEDFLFEFSNWTLISDTELKLKKLSREINFPTFIQAFGYLSKIALLSEKLDHHAEIYNSYGKIKIVIFTHSLSTLTNLDRTFAFHAEILI